MKKLRTDCWKGRVLFSSFLLIMAGCGDAPLRSQGDPEVQAVGQPRPVQQADAESVKPVEPDPEPAETADLQVTDGMSEREVLERLGEPTGIMQISDRKLLTYPGGKLEISNGRVVNLDSDFVDNMMTAKEAAVRNAEFEQNQRAKGLVLYDGAWMTPDEKEKLSAQNKLREDARQRKRDKLAALEKRYNSVEYRDKSGRKVDHSRLLTRGKITIVDFYADWCGPCRQIAPKLAAYVRGEPLVVLKKVNIGEWGSVPSRKYNVTSVPSLRVFDKKGRLMGPPTSSLREAQKYVEAAKRRP